MEGRVELQDITGPIGNTDGESETGYEIPTTSNIMEHEYMAISPIPTISHGNGDVPKYITMTEMAAFKRKMYIFNTILLTLLVIVSVTSGVLIYNLVMQVEKANIKSDDIQAQIEHLKSGSGEAKPTSTNAVQTKMVELESKLEAYKIDIKKIQDTKSAFSIFFSSLTYDTTTNVLIFRSTHLNVGGHFDNTTGIFTCQYSGIYVFVLNLYRGNASGSRVRCLIRKNSISIAYANAPKYTEDSFNGGSGSAVLHLEPGDKVDVGSCVGTDNIDNYTSFMEFLLQAD